MEKKVYPMLLLRLKPAREEDKIRQSQVQIQKTHMNKILDTLTTLGAGTSNIRFDKETSLPFCARAISLRAKKNRCQLKTMLIFYFGRLIHVCWYHKHWLLHSFEIRLHWIIELSIYWDAVAGKHYSKINCQKLSEYVGQTANSFKNDWLWKAT